MSSTVDEDYLRKQVMIGQFVNVVGCTSEQALQMLQSAQWNYEACTKGTSYNYIAVFPFR